MISNTKDGLREATEENTEGADDATKDTGENTEDGADEPEDGSATVKFEDTEDFAESDLVRAAHTMIKNHERDPDSTERVFCRHDDLVALSIAADAQEDVDQEITGEQGIPNLIKLGGHLKGVSTPFGKDLVLTITVLNTLENRMALALLDGGNVNVEGQQYDLDAAKAKSDNFAIDTSTSEEDPDQLTLGEQEDGDGEDATDGDGDGESDTPEEEGDTPKFRVSEQIEADMAQQEAEDAARKEEKVPASA